MAGHDLIVVGGSAGGVEAVSALLAGLSADLPAAVCVVVHLRPDAESRLARVLQRATTLRVVTARHRMRLQRGMVYVAPPDLHLLVERAGDDGMLRLARGPRENRARPAIDPLFRSAALAFGERVIGVVLSGALDDGTAGLWTVKDRGGVAIVQDPDDAAVPSMPLSVLNEVEVDAVVPARTLGPLVGRLARDTSGATDVREGATDEEPTAELEREVAITRVDDALHVDDERYGEPSRFVCPDCGGVLWDLSANGPLRFRCEVGHAHSPASLAEAQSEMVEAAMWTALRALEDKVALARRRGATAAERGLRAFVRQFAVEEQAAEQHAAALRAILRLDGRSGIRPRVGERGEHRVSDDTPADVECSAGTTDAPDAAADVEDPPRETLATG